MSNKFSDTLVVSIAPGYGEASPIYVRTSSLVPSSVHRPSEGITARRQDEQLLWGSEQVPEGDEEGVFALSANDKPSS